MKYFLLLSILYCITIICKAQNVASRNFVHMELGGKYLQGTGISYEYALPISNKTALTGSLGMGLLLSDENKGNFPHMVPATLGLVVGKKSGKFAFGFLHTMMDRRLRENDDGDESVRPTTVYLGYRYIPLDGKGVSFRIDAMPLPVEFLGVIPWFGLGVGYNF